MNFDNRIFNLNGVGKEALRAVLELAFIQTGSNTKAKGFIKSPEKGLILCWHCDNQTTKFPAPLDAVDVLPIVLNYLDSDEAKLVPCEDWDADCDHDGHNSVGWRVYVENWGHVEENRYVICAIRRTFLWHGK